MTARVEKVNPKILRECREQIGLDIEDVKKKVGKISDIEEGMLLPTYKQLTTLSDLYEVPCWVLVSDSLPDRYHFDDSNFAFRNFKSSDTQRTKSEALRVTAKVSQFREFLLELRDDIEEPIEPFNPPELRKDIPDTVARVREWLNANGSHDFKAWKEMLEEKNIFIFMTSKYKGWSHVDRDAFRGLAIHHQILPVIIINDSDAKKAQSFTLFHELGHLLRNETVIDGWSENSESAERWCDEFAGNFLMPTKDFREDAQYVKNLDDVKRIAKKFKVSSYACLVRLRQLNIITNSLYREIDESRKKANIGVKRGFGRRNRPNEVLNQYGRIYVNAIFQTYYNKEIGLTRLCKLLDLKRADDALELGEKL